MNSRELHFDLRKKKRHNHRTVSYGKKCNGTGVDNISKAAHLTPTSKKYDSAHDPPNNAVNLIMVSSGVFTDREKEKGNGCYGKKITTFLPGRFPRQLTPRFFHGIIDVIDGSRFTSATLYGTGKREQRMLS